MRILPSVRPRSRPGPVARRRCRRPSRSRRREGRRQRRDAEPPPGSTPRRCRRCRCVRRAPRATSCESTRFPPPCVTASRRERAAASRSSSSDGQAVGAGPPRTSALSPPVAELDVLDGMRRRRAASSARLPRLAAERYPSCDELEAPGRSDGLDPRPGVELAEDRRHVVVDGSPRDHEPVRDLCVPQALREEC